MAWPGVAPCRLVDLLLWDHPWGCALFPAGEPCALVPPSALHSCITTCHLPEAQWEREARVPELPLENSFIALLFTYHRNTGHHVWDIALDILTLTIVIYLKFTWSWASCISSGDPMWVAYCENMSYPLWLPRPPTTVMPVAAWALFRSVKHSAQRPQLRARK